MNAIDDAAVPPYEFSAHGKRFRLTCERGRDAYELVVTYDERRWKGETPIISLNVAEDAGDLLRPIITSVYKSMEQHIRDVSAVHFDS